MNWKDAKPLFESGITAVLSGEGFEPDGGRFEWRRYVNDVCQLLVAEKMTGDFVRLRAFVLGPDLGPVGGNLTQTSIHGPASHGSDYYWSLEAKSVDSRVTGSIPSVLEKIALPWFGTICDQDRLRRADQAYPAAMRYTLTPDYFASARAQSRQLAAKYPLWTPDRLQELLNEHLARQLESTGFEASTASFTWTRQRPPITDVFEVLPINHGVHIVCFAYNWVAELAADEDGEFSPESRVVLVGGAIQLQADDDTSVAIGLGTAPSAGKTLNNLAQVLVDQTFPKLASIETMKDFVGAVDEKQRGLLAAFGLDQHS